MRRSMSFTKLSSTCGNGIANLTSSPTPTRRFLGENIRKIDEIYIWFVNIKEERDRSKGEYHKLP